MPRVEELELQPRNVPQCNPPHPPKKKEEGGSVKEEKGTGLRCVLYCAIFMIAEAEGGEGGISSLSFLSAISIYPHCLSPHHHLHPRLLRHFGRSAQVHKTPLRPDCFLCHILCLVSAVIYGLAGSSVCACVCV